MDVFEYLWVMGGSDHHSNGGFCFFGPQSGQQAHAEHDVVQVFGLRAESRRAVLQRQPLRLRMQIGLLGYCFKLSHF